MTMAMATAGILAIVLASPTTILLGTGHRTHSQQRTIIHGTVIIIGVIPSMDITPATTMIHTITATVMGILAQAVSVALETLAQPVALEEEGTRSARADTASRSQVENPCLQVTIESHGEQRTNNACCSTVVLVLNEVVDHRNRTSRIDAPLGLRHLDLRDIILEDAVREDRPQMVHDRMHQRFGLLDRASQHPDLAVDSVVAVSEEAPEAVVALVVEAHGLVVDEFASIV